MACSTDPARLDAAGAHRTFGHMAELPALLQSAGHPAWPQQAEWPAVLQ
jgi:hypothetical protein